ncbi:MAG: glycosyltransferase family 2 protein [Planctomycetes bacterium]|nr:glycosyltransferase family 2 protein [Planctomycetota bacterium]
MSEKGVTRDVITISAVMPAYNAEKYIARAIDSVLKQRRQPDEIIVIDDGSTDGTAEIVNGYGDKVRYVYQENGGESAARNTGIKEASCDWIAFLDSDDEWLEGNLEMLEDVILSNENLVWAFGNFYNCDCRTETRKAAHKSKMVDTASGGKDFFDNYLVCFREGFHAWTGSNLIKKTVFDEVGLYVLGQHRGADTDMWLRIAYQWPEVGYEATPLAVYHKGIETSVSSIYRNFDIISEMIDKHLKLSAEKGYGADFVPCASGMLGNWIRDMVSTGDTEGLLETIERFDSLLTWRFKKEMRLRVKHPRIAPIALALTSSFKKCNRFLLDRFVPGRK